jgi:hydroxyacylglutathione hydrolase
MIYIERFIVNPLRENSYLLYDETGECLVVDAGMYYDEEFDELNDFIAAKNLKPVGLINTHCHFDHLMGIERLRKKYDLRFLCHADDVFLVGRAVKQADMFGFTMDQVGLPDGFLQEGEKLHFGTSALKVLHIPGIHLDMWFFTLKRTIF